MLKAASCLAVLAALSLGACATSPDQRTVNGALIGGTTGAVIGGVTTHTPGGAIVGGVIGATTGAVIADATRPHYDCHWSERLGRRVCHRA
ncbi:MAG: YMGG-like glycine zipper-containing protein [Ancalomicrobiaceae bacterium]|nr:YMGG-like glycine zipper-containing protein [Ancalomicrobiaceae bacterium]